MPTNQDAIQHVIRWNIERRNAARALKNVTAVNHFQGNIDQLRSLVWAKELVR